MWQEHPVLVVLMLWTAAAFVFAGLWAAMRFGVKRLPRGACWCGRPSVEACFACEDELCLYHLQRRDCVRCGLLGGG